MAGCVLMVWLSASAGPSSSSRRKPAPRASAACERTRSISGRPAYALSMPTACEPLQQHAMAGADFSGAHELVERQRHGSGRGIAVVVDRDHELLARQDELARRR